MQGMLVFSPNLAIVDPAELVMRYGPVFFFALLAAPFFPVIAERAERRGLAFMLFVVPAILVLDPLIASALERRIGYLHYRILDAAPLVVMLALFVGGLAERLVMGEAAGRGSGKRPRPLLSVRGAANRIIAAALLVLFIAYPFRAASLTRRGIGSRAPREALLDTSFVRVAISALGGEGAGSLRHSERSGDELYSFGVHRIISSR